MLLLSGSEKTGLINVYDVRLYDTTAGDVWPPSQYPMGLFLNSKEIRKAIHSVELFEWHECSGPVNRYLGKDNMKASRPLIVKAMDTHKLPVLVYNGQFDLICNHVGTEAYLSTMIAYKDLEKFLASRRAVWNVGGEIAGYVKHAEGTKLTFLLVLGGSHMAPMDRPKQCYDMIHRFMNGRGYNDEETLVALPFTPTVPFIPGDVVTVNDTEEDERKHSKPPGDLVTENAQPNIFVSTPTTSTNEPPSYAVLLFFTCFIFTIISGMYLYTRKRREYDNLA
eukprot:TRINITY_DN2371_c0_g1_i9.p1 TRINITY_DN2371_c0_g1~~TRINITY_DN2371_c0_g1_i9.p1  ORF type:complete len:280 (+),score=21.01 TRINITY_DN2371_c0_g1_i9:340-1179(+)